MLSFSWFSFVTLAFLLFKLVTSTLRPFLQKKKKNTCMISKHNYRVLVHYLIMKIFDTKIFIYFKFKKLAIIIKVIMKIENRLI